MTDSSPVVRLQAAVERRRAKKRERLEQIMVRAQNKGSITNNDVELLVHVTDATATRYLAQLVKEGRLKRIGAQKRPRYEPFDGFDELTASKLRTEPVNGSNSAV